MRLSKLTVQGFKSFAERLEFIFGPGITAIVGPNGSGKSNVVDAIRWAVGEQSMRSLRSERLEDIIFNGSSFRRPYGLAEVSLTFDNEAGLLPVPYSEVTVTRRAYRSGNSEFYLNGVPCRLRDIQDLFADTGIGKDGYAFIGQGKVDEVLNLSPAQRRIFLEQAASVWGWQRRKSEAENKLVQTEQDLRRLKDICIELERQREPLIKEAEQAEIYRTKSNRLKELQIFVGLAEIQRIGTKIAALETKLAPERQRLLDQARERSELETELERRQAAITAYELHLEELKNQKASIRRQLDLTEKKHTALQDQAREREVRQEAIRGQGQELAARCLKLITEQAQYRQELARVTVARQTKEATISRLQKEFTDLEQKHEYIQQQTQRHREQIIDCLSEQSAHNNALRSLTREQQALMERHERVLATAKRSQERADALIKLQQRAEEEINAYSQQKRDLEQERMQLERQLANIRRQENTAVQNWSSICRAYDSLKAKLAGLQSLQENYGSYYQGPRSILKVGRPGIIGAVAQLVIVPPEYETAIETALGVAQQYLVAADDEQAAAAIDWLHTTGGGRATFLPLNTIQPRERSRAEEKLSQFEGAVGWADHLVRYPPHVAPAVKYLLGRVLVAQNLNAARTLAKASSFRLKIVTIAGDVVYPGGSLAGGSGCKKQSSQISLERQLRELKQTVKEQKHELAERTKIKEAVSSHRQGLENKLAQLADDGRDLDRKLLAAASKKKEYAAQLTETKQNLAVWEQEKQVLAAKIQELVAEKEQRLKSGSMAAENLGQWEKAAAEQEKSLHALQEQLEKVRQEMLALRLEVATCQEQEKQLQFRNEEYCQSLEQLELQRTQVKDKLNDLKQLAFQEQGAQQKLEEKTTALSLQLTQIKEQIQQVEKMLAQLRTTLRDHDRELLQLVKTEEKQRNKVHYLELKLGRLEADYDGAQRHLFETQAVPKDYPLPDLGLKPSEARNEIKRLKQEVAAFGEVNLTAPQTLAQLNERYQFISEQVKDVELARTSLLEVIAGIDQTVATRLHQTFDQLRNNFQTIFQHLFQGGKGDLKLIHDDSNETGLEIFAQLPGKKMQPLLALSGGERALTAIGFLFALLKCSQSSVCILDEIDAPLDEANADRFLSYLEKLAENTQFITVTHKRQAMARAQTLYGLAMAPNGTSSLVSVDLTDVAS